MNLNSSITNSTPLLSNATACQVLANIAAMQFYYPVLNYAYDLYKTYIWDLLPNNWSGSTIPFLAYPSTYYSDVTNSSYNWISATFSQNDLLRIKLAKYSARGAYLGRFDGFDTILQLCGGGYSHGRAAFTFGTVYKRTVGRVKSCRMIILGLSFSVQSEPTHSGIHRSTKRHFSIHVNFIWQFSSFEIRAFRRCPHSIRFGLHASHSSRHSELSIWIRCNTKSEQYCTFLLILYTFIWF